MRKFSLHLSDRIGLILLFFVSLASPAQVSLRVVTFNGTSGNYQSWDPGEGQRILQALKPDLALLQEFNYGDNSSEQIGNFVEETFARGFAWYREDNGEQGGRYLGYQIPNGIVSRYPIVAEGSERDTSIDNRGFAWTVIRLPGGKKLLAISVHLSHGKKEARATEARQLVRRANELKREYAIDYMLLGGDLNLISLDEKAMQILKTVFSDAHRPVDTQGVAATSKNRRKVYDLLLPDPKLEAFHSTLNLGGRKFPHGVVFDTREFTPLGALPPAQVGDSEAPNMQHMAVMKHFMIP